MRTLRELAKEALSIQDACNPIALANGYGRSIADLREALGVAGLPADSAAIKHHAINQLWISKLVSLSHYNDAAFGGYFDEVNALIE